MLIVPLNIVVTPFAESGQTEPSTWTGTGPTDALRVANTIWNERHAKTQMNNLMVEGLTIGTSLTPSQMNTAKAGKLAKKFGG